MKNFTHRPARIAQETEDHIDRLIAALDVNAERARCIYSRLAGRLPIKETPADISARVAARDELDAIFLTLTTARLRVKLEGGR